MSVMELRFFSESLNMFTNAKLILPLPRDVHASVESLPVLYLLHGMGDDSTAWLRKTCIERYALECGIAVVMPDGALSCYENMVHGARYRDFISAELPGFIRANFPVSAARERNFIAGCSMGGFGALKLGLANPGLYRVIGCFSAAHFEYRPDSPRHHAMLQRAYGDQIDTFEARIVQDIAHVNAGRLPLRILHCCGDADILKENALKTRAHFEALPGGSIDYAFEMLSGRHDWALWDEAVRRFLRALNLPKPEVHLF